MLQSYPHGITCSSPLLILDIDFLPSPFYPLAECEESLTRGLSSLTVRSGLAEVIDTAYSSDDRIKKGGKHT